MYSWVQLQHLIQWTNARATHVVSGFAVKAIATDSRTISKGDVFLALRGERFDGHQYIQEAIKNGASALIVENEAGVTFPTLQVADSLKALIAIGAKLRERFSGMVFGITGSAGKSTTKNMLADLLGDKALRSPASFNNLIGVSKTLCLINDTTEYLVLELGSNAPGEIAMLCEHFSPTAGLITNIGTAHMGRLGGQEGIFLEKSALFKSVIAQKHAHGLAINLDDQWIQKYYLGLDQQVLRIVRYSLIDRSADIFVTDIKVDPHSGFLNMALVMDGATTPITLPFFGVHHAANLAAAMSLARLAEIPRTSLIQRLDKLKPSYHRGEILNFKTQEITVIDESYNSNPSALKSSLETLALLDPNRRRVLVLGDMRELEEFSQQAHAEIGNVIVEQFKKRHTPLVVFGVGSEIQYLLDPIKRNLPNATLHQCASVEETLQKLNLSRNDIVFVKGSRAHQLDRIIEKVKSDLA